MKKLLSVLLVMFALTVMNSGCEKDSDSDKPVTSESVITLPELTGDWEIVSVYFTIAGESYTVTNCGQLFMYGIDFRTLPNSMQSINFKFTSTLCTMTNKCSSTNIVTNTPFKIEGKYIAIGNDPDNIFEILSYDKITKTMQIHGKNNGSAKHTIRKL